MDKQKALETIDAALLALNGLQQALDLGDMRSVDIELHTAREELMNLREMVEKEKDK
jgi:hypothetical protein